MTPQNKAKELVKKYILLSWKGKEFNLEYYKQCALIAVDEIIKAIPCREDYGGDGWMLIDNTEYYQEVKQEIELL